MNDINAKDLGYVDPLKSGKGSNMGKNHSPLLMHSGAEFL